MAGTSRQRMTTASIRIPAPSPVARSPLTSKTHVSRIMTKLNARDRAQLVVIAYESGLVTPGQRA
jgi:hypothetical protein